MGVCRSCPRRADGLEEEFITAHKKQTLAQTGRVPIFIMMQLDWMSEDGTSLRYPDLLAKQLLGLKAAAVQGVMADVWWGPCEPSPGKYNFGAAKELCKLLKSMGLQLQATMSFHQCGGNVGDPLTIPIPAWAMAVAREKDMLYRNGTAHVSEDCLSLSADACCAFPGVNGSLRTPLDCYRDFIAAFVDVCRDFIGSTIREIQVGMGACGELRYPSYMMSKGWEYPGVGLVMADDEGMRRMLKEDTGLEELPEGLPVDQNAMPDESVIFCASKANEEKFRTEPAKTFFEWYTRVLINHGEAVLAEAGAALKQAECSPSRDQLGFSVKVSGLHWHVLHPSRATEACAGYNNCTSDESNAYNEIAKMLARATQKVGRPIFFNFTCLEMSNTDNNGSPKTLSAPEDLISQVRKACVRHAIPLSGENALEFDLAQGGWAFERMAKQLRGWSPGRDKMHALTLLRLNERMVTRESLRALGKFVAET